MNIFVVTGNGSAVIAMVPMGTAGLAQRYPGARFGTSEATSYAEGQPPPADIKWIDPSNPAQVAGVTVVARIDLFRRATEKEADAIDAAIMNAPSRLRNIFTSAVMLRSDSPEWDALMAIARAIVDETTGQPMLSEQRIAQLLAPSE